MASTSEPGAALLRSRIEDTIRLCDRRSTPCFLGFLDAGEQAQAMQLLQKRADVCWRLFGGHADAERQILGVFPEYMQPEDAAFPLCACAFFYRQEKALSHRDFLVTLLSAGLRRETIGDILCGEGIAVVFLREEIVSFICDQIQKVGGEGVRIETGYTGALPAMHSFQPMHETVASPRLDVVVKALLHCSREQAAQLILTGAVSVDHLPVETVSAQVVAPATVSVRGHGRYAVDEIGSPTRKGRLVLLARRYI